VFLENDESSPRFEPKLVMLYSKPSKKTAGRDVTPNPHRRTG